VQIFISIWDVIMDGKFKFEEKIRDFDVMGSKFALDH